MSREPRRFRYRIGLGVGEAKVIDIVLAPEGVTCLEPVPAARPWTALECNRCEHCPLDPAAHALCPLAARLDPLVEIIGAVLSYTRVKVELEANNRLVSAEISAQAAASSIMGLISATSGCPHTAFLKPMAWFHQPFATEEETVFRAASVYLLGQYMRQREGFDPDWAMAELSRRYDALHRVNIGIAKRLRKACPHDAAVNAIIRLDMFTIAVSGSLEEALKELRGTFLPLIDGA